MSNRLELIKNKNTRRIDPYNLTVRYKDEYWSIQNINFNTYKITIQNRSTVLAKHLNEVELVEYFD